MTRERSAAHNASAPASSRPQAPQKRKAAPPTRVRKRTLLNSGVAFMCKLGLIALAAWAFSRLADVAPAFSDAARAPGPTGSWTPSTLSHLYAPSSYLLGQGQAYLRAAGDTEDAVTRRAYAVQAIALIEKSLSMRPTNAFAWTSRGVGRALLGDVEGVRADLRQSAAYAPNHAALALARLDVLAAIWADLDPEDRRSAMRDIAIVNQARGPWRRRFATLAESRPILARLRLLSLRVHGTPPPDDG